MEVTIENGKDVVIVDGPNKAVLLCSDEQAARVLSGSLQVSGAVIGLTVERTPS